MVIHMGTGIVSESRFIKLDLSLPEYKIKADYNEYPVKEFYSTRYTESSTSSTSNKNTNLTYGLISCFYRPMIIVDFSPRFEYK